MIKFFAQHPTAANLLMVALLAIGIFALPSIRRETFPEYVPSEVEIRIAYPGATAEEVEEAVCQRVEDALDGINFVEEIRSDAREGFAIITVEMAENGHFQSFLNDIKKEIEAIDNFPSEVEDPFITELGQSDLVLSVLISGPINMPDLKAFCEDLKERMQEAGLLLIDIRGFSEHQIRVELDVDALQLYNLNAAQVADIIGRQNIDLPGGAIETRDRDILLRFVDQRRSPVELEKLVILAGPKGGEIRLGDIAKISDRFDKDEDKIMMNGRRNALLDIKKSKTQDAIRVANKAKAFIADERKRHPEMELLITQDQSLILIDRLKMLITNGWQGLLLVFFTMWLFFNLKISFWVAMGLPVSFLGAFFFLPQFDLTINMMTMVGLLLALGLMMDDAIVIAENIATHRQQGKAALKAAVEGTREVMVGVISSFITTICILGPLAFIKGQIGRVLKVIPMILILIMAVSLIEAFLILPSHLGHAMHGYDPRNRSRLRRVIDGTIEWIREQLVGRTIDFLLEWRYIFIGLVLSTFIVSVGMIISGRVKTQGFPELEGDVVVARLLMSQGSPLTRTENMVNHILGALERMNSEFKPLQPMGQDLVKNANVQFNQNADAFENGPHVATITVDLLSAEKRSGLIDDYLEAWRRQIGTLPDVINLTLTEPGFGPAGRPIEIRLRGKDLVHLKQAIGEVKAWFNRFEGVLNLTDDLRPGKPELRMRLRKDAYSLGIDAVSVAQQLRASFQGLTVDEVQVGPESYEIDVRMSSRDKDSLADLEYFNLVLPDGRQVPLTTVAEWYEGRGWARIARFNGKRAITLRGDIDTRVANTNELMNLFQKTFLPKFTRKYHDIQLTIAGEIEEAGRTQKSIFRAMAIGLIGIFICLSFQFRSYTEPLIVMVAIPFTLIGVVWGHILMGIPISMPSILGLIALAGIVVNDSILLVVFLKRSRADGLDLREAAAQASRARFRAVLLTSATTIAGLLPLFVEKSLQAQVLIPLVVSTAFGLMASTILILLVIPCMYMILGDLGLLKKLASQTNSEPSEAPAEART